MLDFGFSFVWIILIAHKFFHKFYMKKMNLMLALLPSLENFSQNTMMQVYAL